jgi:hypothetical protein
MVRVTWFEGISVAWLVAACGNGGNAVANGPIGDAAGGASAGGTGAGGSAGVSTPSAPLYTLAPDCGVNEANMSGTFEGDSVLDYGILGSNNYTTYEYFTLVANSNRAPLRLEWQAPLENGVVQSLTGGYFLSTWRPAPEDQILYCITAGEIGRVEDSGEIYFKYHIKAGQSGEVGQTGFDQSASCDGAAVTVDLVGCVRRD